MAVIPKLSVGSFKIFTDSGYTTKSFVYTTKEKAEEELPTNLEVENLPTVNIVFILKESKLYVWNIEGQVLMTPKKFFDLGVTSSSYIDFDGNDDTLDFENSGDLLDFSKDWTLGITYLGKPIAQDSKYLTIFQNGQNRIMFRQGGDNQGVYVTSKQATYTWGANTWYALEYGDKLLFIYNSATRKLNIKVNGVQNWNISMGANETGAGEPNGLFSIGKSKNDVGNYWNESHYKHFYGGFNNFIAMNSVMGEIAIAEYFELSSEVYTDEEGDHVAGDYMESQNFSIDLTCYAPLGESPHPTVVDKKGLLTGGVFSGFAGAYKPVPKPEVV